MLDEIGVFYRGLVLGVMIAAPVGPVGLLCIRRSIQKGLLVGLATGLGAACADTIFSAVAALGVTAILEFMMHYRTFIHVVGGGFLILVAWHTWHDQPQQPKQDTTVSGVLKALISGFVITMTNPVTIFAVLAVVATFGNLHSQLDIITLVSGIFSGSALWWLLLSGGIGLLRCHFTENRVMVINRVAAVALAGFALWALISGLRVFLGH